MSMIKRSSTPMKWSGSLLARCAAVAILASGMASQSMASGSFGGGSGFGPQNAYNLGKAVFYKKLACDGCPVENTQLDSESAGELIDKLNSNQDFASEVTGKKRKAVILYLQRRFNAS